MIRVEWPGDGGWYTKAYLPTLIRYLTQTLRIDPMHIKVVG